MKETMMRHDARNSRPRFSRDQAGMVGKFIVVWLLLLALLGIAAVDAASIVFTRFRLDDAAATAASTAATTYQNDRDAGAACDAAQVSVHAADPNALMAKTWCKVDTSSGEVTITLRKTANTVLAGRLSITQDLTKVVQRETAGPSSL
jgi:Flp pilus assembly protein TadG